MSHRRMIPRTSLAALIGVSLTYGCASSKPRTAADSASPPSPLAGMIGRHMVVFPSQYLSTPGPGNSWEVSQVGPALLPILDEEIADSFRKRGVNSNWTFAREITASADRNGGLAGNARQLSAQGIRRVAAGDTPLPEPLASELRTLVALTSARFAILPIETHLDTRNGERKGSLRILLIDSRTARVVWADDVEVVAARDPTVVSEAMSPFGFRLFARELASRLADMVVAQ